MRDHQTNQSCPYHLQSQQWCQFLHQQPGQRYQRHLTPLKNRCLHHHQEPTLEIILNQLNEFLAQEGNNIKVPLSKGDLGGYKGDLEESNTNAGFPNSLAMLVSEPKG